MPVKTPNPAVTQRHQSQRSESLLERSQRTRLAWMLGIFVLAAVLLFWRQLQMMVSLWFHNGALSIGALVPFVSAYFGWRAWQRTESLPIRPAISGFVCAVAAALAVIGWNSAARNGVSLSLVLIPLFLAGCMASVAGWRIVREFLFPLAFLWFLVPVPPPVLGLIDYPLQLLCARVVEGVGHLLHLHVIRIGTMVGPTPDVAVTIAPECNGVRSSVALVMITIILAKLKTIRVLPAIALVVAAIPLAYAANFVRLCGLFLLTTVFGERFMPYEHRTDLISGGIWFFITVLLMSSIAQRLGFRVQSEPLP
jgi:exosortase